MKAMKLTGIRQMEMLEVPTPEIINPTDVKIKVECMGVCGSDIHYYVSGKIGTQVVKYPFTVGHEAAGKVTEVGSAVTSVKPGDRIAIEPAVSCYECDQCKQGRFHTCRNLKFLGCPGQLEGLLSEYIVMPQESCIPIPDSMSYTEAAITEPLAIGVYGVQQSIPMKGAKVGILGAGSIGESVLLPAIAQGAEAVYITDKIDSRLTLALENKARWGGNPDKVDIVKEIKDLEPLGLDVVFDCCGDQEALNQALEILRPGGRLMIIGIPEVNRISFNINHLRHKEVTITNVRRQVGCVEPSIEMIEKKEIDVSNWSTHRFSFEDTQKAFDLVANYEDGVLKAMIDF